MSNVNHIGTPKALSPAQLHSTENKAFRANKAYGSLDPNFDYSGWLEEARAWVAAVHSGQAQDDPQMPVAQYEQTIAEVEAMIFGGGAGGMGMGGLPWEQGMPGASAGPQPPPGAVVGADGNFVFDSKDAELIYDGSPQRSDVNSTNVTLAVDSMGATYSWTQITDATGNPAWKLVIDSQARGQQTYVFNGVDDPDFHLDLFAANVDNVNLPDELQGKVTVKDIENLENEIASPQSSIEGEPVEGEDNAYKYTATLVTDVIDFYPTAGDNETHYVTGNTTINIPLDSSATVAPLMDNSHPGYNYVVVVTHQEPAPNGSTDTFYLKGGSFDHHINGLPENISFLTGANPDGTPIAETGKVPTGYQDDFTIYGAEGAGAAAFPGDSVPDSSVADPAANGAVTNTYNTQADVTIHAGNAENCTTHDIYATGTVNISAADNQTQVTIDRQDDGTIVIMTPASDGTVEIFKVHPGTAGLPNINIAGNNIVYGPGLGGPGSTLNDDQGLVAFNALGKINVNGVNQAQAAVAAGGGVEPVEDKATPMLEALSSATGKSLDRILEAINNAIPGTENDYADLDALKAAMNSEPGTFGHFPPGFSIVDSSAFGELVHALYELDGDISGPLVSQRGVWDGDIADPNTKAATEELVELLNILYPDHSISMTYPDDNWRKGDIITFDDETFGYATYTEGSSTFDGIELRNGMNSTGIASRG